MTSPVMKRYAYIDKFQQFDAASIWNFVHCSIEGFSPSCVDPGWGLISLEFVARDDQIHANAKA